MATKIYTNEFNNVTRLWVKKDEGFTLEEHKFMKDAGMRPSKNPKSWFVKHDDATEAVIRNYFEGDAPDETRYEPVEESENKPQTTPPRKTKPTVHTSQGETEARYVYGRKTDLRIDAWKIIIEYHKADTKLTPLETLQQEVDLVYADLKGE